MENMGSKMILFTVPDDIWGHIWGYEQNLAINSYNKIIALNYLFESHIATNS
jgi:hypothetical protein